MAAPLNTLKSLLVAVLVVLAVILVRHRRPFTRHSTPQWVVVTMIAFLGAAYDTFIPADKLSPSGTVIMRIRPCNVSGFFGSRMANLL